LRRRGIAHTVPERRDQRQRRAARYRKWALNYRAVVIVAALLR